MPTIQTNDGVALFYDEAGSGTPVVFVHEFAGDHRSWKPQMRQFARTNHAIAYNARGYPPSDVPAPEAYSQDRAVDDIRDVLDALGIDTAHIVGLSMGGFATAHFGLRYPNRARSLVIAGCGYGSERSQHAKFAAEALASADRIERDGMAKFASEYGEGPTRVQFANKDPRGHAEFLEQLAEHSADGAARTMRGYQAKRPSLYDFEDGFAKMTVPTLIVTGDEDWPCLMPNIWLKQTIPSAGLLVLPNTGHAINLEEPAKFNQIVGDFHAQVEAGRWPVRDPRAISESITGITADT